MEKIRGQELDVRHILIMPKVSNESLKKAKDKIENIRAKILAGEITFETVFIWEDYVQPPSHSMLDKKAFLKITINSATFLKDADFIGK